jgi:HK97 family phage portal protein
MPGALVGLNPIEVARTSFALSKAAETYGAAFFGNSAHASGVISVQGTLNKEEQINLGRQWIEAHQGLGKAQLPAVLTGGATWTPISIAPDDAQFLQTRQFSRAEVAMMFRVPPHMIGDVDRTTSWGTGIEQQEIGFVVNTLRPFLSKLEGAFFDLLPKPIYAKFDVSGRLRGDTLQRFQAYTLARNGSWLSPNEIREMEDRPPIEGGDDYWAPMNFMPLDQFGDNVPPPAVPPAPVNPGP